MNQRARLKRCVAIMVATGCVVAAGGCGRSGDPPPPLPTVAQKPAADAPPPATPDTTPKAGDVFKEGAPPSATSTNARPIDQTHAMTRQEESTAMPMPGQANDHSTLAAEPVKR